MKKDILISSILFIYFIVLGLLYMVEYNKVYLIMVGLGIIATMIFCIFNEDVDKDELSM